MVRVYLRKQASVVKGLLLRYDTESTSVCVRGHTKIRCRFPYGTHPTHFYSCERWTVLRHVLSWYVDSAREKCIMVNGRFSFAVLL